MVESLTLKQLVSVMNLSLSKQEGGEENPLMPKRGLCWWGELTEDWGKGRGCLRRKVCISSVSQSCPTLCNPMDCSTPGLPVHYQIPELAQTHAHRVGDAIQPSHPRPLLLPSIFPSIRVFSSESVLCIRLPKYWSFIFNIIPSNEHPGLISFTMDWFNLLAVQGTLRSLLQHHSSKASILQHSAFF